MGLLKKIPRCRFLCPYDERSVDRNRRSLRRFFFKRHTPLSFAIRSVSAYCDCTTPRTLSKFTSKRLFVSRRRVYTLLYTCLKWQSDPRTNSIFTYWLLGKKIDCDVGKRYFCPFPHEYPWKKCWVFRTYHPTHDGGGALIYLIRAVRPHHGLQFSRLCSIVRRNRCPWLDDCYSEEHPDPRGLFFDPDFEPHNRNPSSLLFGNNLFRDTSGREPLLPLFVFPEFVWLPSLEEFLSELKLILGQKTRCLDRKYYSRLFESPFRVSRFR